MLILRCLKRESFENENEKLLKNMQLLHLQTMGLGALKRKSVESIHPMKSVFQRK